MNSITRRLRSLLAVAESNVAIVSKECNGELGHDPDAEYLNKQLIRAEKEIHFAIREWDRYRQILIWRAEADANANRASTN